MNDDLVSAQDVARMAERAKQENAIFASKGMLASAGNGGVPVGRVEKTWELVRALAGGLAQGYVPPLVFVYGRTGSGKSTVVRFVCESLPVSLKVVNLRRARTAFGCAGLILEGLGGEPAGSGQSLGLLMEGIAAALEAAARERRLVLVLDEFDALLSDRRGRASDLVYRLLDVQQGLREKGLLVCMLAISNNVMAAGELDDRVRSRIGAAPEVYFDAYSQKEIVAILEDRAQTAFSAPVSGEVIERCAKLSSDERGDARRAIDLLRAAAEVAGAAGEKAIALAHVEAAVAQLQKETVELAIARAPYHARVACAGLARVAFLAPGQAWYATSTLYRQYCSSLQKGVRPLGYRRFSELLVELENLGLAASQVGSKGRGGYGREYRLAVPPEVVGTACFPTWWGELLKKKKKHEEDLEAFRERSQDSEVHKYGRRGAREALAREKEKWIEFVGL